MKKSFISLLLMSSAVFGADLDLINENIKAITLNSGYESVSSAYTLTITLDLNSNSCNFMTLSDGWYLYTNQTNQVGVTTGNDPAKWVYDADGNTTHDAYEGTVNQKENTWLYASGSAGTLNNAVITLSTTEMFGTLMTTLTVQHGETTGVYATILDSTGKENIALDLNKVEITGNVSAATLSVNGAPAVDLTSKLVPEPTTATLSLLALAGLAARRRRK